MKICAASRLLICADADEQAARDFLQEVAGISVGRKLHSQPDLMHFEITSAQLPRAMKNLERYFGPPSNTNKISRYAGGTFYTDSSRTRYVTVGTTMGKHDSGYIITIGDTSHKESIQEMMRRILKPTFTRPL